MAARSIFEVDDFEWETAYYDDKPYLSYTEKDKVKLAKCGVGCGNPWNYIDNELRKELMEEKPAKKFLFSDSNAKVLNHFYSKTEVDEQMKDYIAADCWGVMAVNDNRGAQLVYFDHINKTRTNKSYSTRTKLCEDVSRLFEDLDKGYTIYIKLGSRDFIDVYVKKIPDSKLYLLTQNEFNL
jgi:hypothetical protein